MALIPLPTATIHDADIACVLRRAVDVINPTLDLWATDPLGLKQRSHATGSSDAVGRALDSVAWTLNAADVPGTKSWEGMSVDDRIDWWVNRVGAVDTLLVATPGVFGAIADRLPVQDFLGFANQVVVLCAVARESGVTEHPQQVRMLGAVMCDRNLEPDGAQIDAPPAVSKPRQWSPKALAELTWQVAGVLRAIGDELVKRQRPRAIFRYLGMLPAVGIVADYLGEYGALVRAAEEGRQWIAAHQP